MYVPDFVSYRFNGFRIVRRLLSIILLCAGFCAHAQPARNINYQCIIRNTAGTPVANQPVSLRFSIHDVSPIGAVQYSETHTTTNAYGLVNLLIGGGTPVTGTIAAVDWGTAKKYLQIEVDIAGGSNYTNLSTTEFVSVPYPMHAQTVTNAVKGVTAGAGLNVSDAFGNVTVSASYGGNGTANTLARSDHNHTGQLWSTTAGNVLRLTSTSSNSRTLDITSSGTDPNAFGVHSVITSATGSSVASLIFLS